MRVYTSEKRSIADSGHAMAGVDDGEDPPVPIPNTEVKLTSVENTWLETAWEDRAVPVLSKSKKLVLDGLFGVYSSDG